MKFQVHAKEQHYFAIMLVFSLAIYAMFFSICIGLHAGGFIPMLAMYVGILLGLQMIGHLFFMGYIKSNAVKITHNQFPEVFDVLVHQSQRLGLTTLPSMYVLQGNGVLNAFATRFAGRNYIVLLSSILEAAYQEGMPAVEFIIGHELGHIKRNHVGLLKAILLFPAKLFPLLSAAYSRACEYTCDNIGYSLSPHGAQKGLLILAAGTQLYKKINVPELIATAHADSGFATMLAERFASHPHLAKRLTALYVQHTNNEFRAFAAQQTTLNAQDASAFAPYTGDTSKQDQSPSA